MIRAYVLIPSLLSVALLGLGACQGTQKHGATKHQHEATNEHSESEENEAQEAEMMEKPATSLSAAIATAQKSAPDAQFLQAEVESEGGKTICSIRFGTSEGEREVNVDAATGTVLETQKEKLDPQSTKLLEELGADPKHAPVGAVQAIDAALAKVPGAWAFAAGFKHDDEDGKLIYAVYMFEGKKVHVAEV